MNDDDDEGIIVGETIEVDTDHGQCEIQLCLGSVTEVKNKVDVLVISAFPGDYTPTPTSVVGALQRDLGISVRDLAKNKEEDLRKLWSCWWSKKLPKKFPYKRIMCFEGGFKKNSRPPSTIGEVFRSLISLCRESDVSVMMPLLSSGNQGYSQQLMLRMIVEATIHWMKIGLKLKVLKIVVYCAHPSRPSNTANLMLNAFRELKENWKIIKDPTLIHVNKNFVYDIYLTYNDSDIEIAGKVAECLSKMRNGIRIYKEQQFINVEESWQQHIYKVMVNCERVIALLSPRFLSDAACIEKYNIALCCSHSMRRDYLAPLYIEEIQQLPTYMGLIQYVDCRPISDSTILNACGKVTSTLKSTESMTERQKALHIKNRDRSLSLDNQYDVFISYSHKDIVVANAIVEHMRKIKKKWNVFIDQSGLRAGSAWQKKLYTSIENSKVVLALLSDNYMNSKVCQEEYNLARSLQDDPRYVNRLVELKLDVVDIWPVWCTPSFFVDLAGEKVDKTKVKQIIQTIEFSINARLDSMQNVICVKQQTSLWRKDFWRRDFPIVENESFADVSLFPAVDYKQNYKYDIVLCYHNNEIDFVKSFVRLVQKYIPNVCISMNNKERSSKLHDLDETSIIVTFLSASFIDSNELMEEFQIALCRHRFSKDLILFPIIADELPLFPLFPQLALCLFALTDSFWYYEEKCLKKAAIVLCNILLKRPQAPFSYVTFMSMLELQEWTSFHARNESNDTGTVEVSPLFYTGNSNKVPVIASAEQSEVDEENEFSHIVTVNNRDKNNVIFSGGHGKTPVEHDDGDETTLISDLKLALNLELNNLEKQRELRTEITEVKNEKSVKENPNHSDTTTIHASSVETQSINRSIDKVHSESVGTSNTSNEKGGTLNNNETIDIHPNVASEDYDVSTLPGGNDLRTTTAQNDSSKRSSKVDGVDSDCDCSPRIKVNTVDHIEKPLSKNVSEICQHEDEVVNNNKTLGEATRENGQNNCSRNKAIDIAKVKNGQSKERASKMCIIS